MVGVNEPVPRQLRKAATLTGMKLAYTQSYPAEPARVVELLQTEGFIEDVAQHAGSLGHTINITADRTALQMKLPVPGHLTKFVGEALELNQVFTFQAARPDGSIPGTVEVTVAGLPVNAAATIELTPVEAGTTATYDGELKVRIPLVGKKVEEQVEPYVRRAFDGVERRATEWLTR